MSTSSPIIDNLSLPAGQTTCGTTWELVSDRVMGGVSDGSLTHCTVEGRPALRMTGTVSLENDGGFLQMALDLRPDGCGVDASGQTGLALDILGNDQRYNIHLRTADVTRPWQSYRAEFTAPGHWTTIKLPFSDFTPHRLTAPLDLSSLRRVGLVAIGRAFTADLALGDLRFY
ncbi:CIA30 family protein [Roseovarius gahaiensis]|uniref:CIA30 family protein n=1 Tax=Roseovarius gahaiensis TaxID=2716691 RepID=A0A967EFE5_9RHOB|nr:CIA30 family protein [Roseovarius gahaiensis]NHQ73415.1 CIA30 family protein [Roseovarius gahaiensis]